jgi:hypothetical protein
MSDPKERRSWPNWNVPARYILAYALAFLVLAYLILLVVGWIPKDGKIDFPTIILLVVTGLGVATLINPGAQQSIVEIFGRVRSFQIASMRFELNEIRAQQIDQSARLEILGLLLPLILTAAERSHLKNLYHDMTTNYVGNSNLRTELRRLRYLTLLRNPREPIDTAKDGRTFDLRELVELTPLGRMWAKQIEEMPTDVATEEQSQEAS